MTAAAHLVLSVVNLIPGEVTVGPVFAAMGLGFVVCAFLVLRGGAILEQLAALYTIGLLLAYVASRLPIDPPLPVEPIGVAVVVDEALLLLVLFRLWRGDFRRSPD